MRPLLTYTVLRLGLFASVMAALYLIGVRGPANPVLAALIAVMLSYLLLRAPRESLARRWADRAGRRSAGDDGVRAPGRRRRLTLDDDTDAEDATLASVQEPGDGRENGP